MPTTVDRKYKSIIDTAPPKQSWKNHRQSWISLMRWS